jgi:hypothetical protein
VPRAPHNGQRNWPAPRSFLRELLRSAKANLVPLVLYSCRSRLGYVNIVQPLRTGDWQRPDVN